jgi:hypothetical protein
VGASLVIGPRPIRCYCNLLLIRCVSSTIVYVNVGGTLKGVSVLPSGESVVVDVLYTEGSPIFCLRSNITFGSGHLPQEKSGVILGTEVSAGPSMMVREVELHYCSL